jgi:putative transposase
LRELGQRTLFIDPGSPWENRHIGSFNGKLRDEMLNQDMFYALREARVLTMHWRSVYNHKGLYSLPRNGFPAPEACLVASFESPLTTAPAFGLTQLLVKNTRASEGEWLSGPANVYAVRTMPGSL